MHIQPTLTCHWKQILMLVYQSYNYHLTEHTGPTFYTKNTSDCILKYFYGSNTQFSNMCGLVRGVYFMNLFILEILHIK
jgi:hypothetical protein